MKYLLYIQTSIIRRTLRKQKLKEVKKKSKNYRETITNDRKKCQIPNLKNYTFWTTSTIGNIFYIIIFYFILAQNKGGPHQLFFYLENRLIKGNKFDVIDLLKILNSMQEKENSKNCFKKKRKEKSTSSF